MVITLRRAAPGDAAAIAEVFLDSFQATDDFPLAHTDDELRGWVRDAIRTTSSERGTEVQLAWSLAADPVNDSV